MKQTVERETEVLIIGAGPTGLVLALWLTCMGVHVRVVDKVSEPGTTSRALGVQARTLELYGQFGLADALVERGLKLSAANLWVRGRKAGRAAFGDMGTGQSPFPYMLIFPQDEHERFLIGRLDAIGVHIEHHTELLSFVDEGDRIRAHLRRPDGTEETCEASYLAACDGAHSMVREVLNTGFPGGTYAHLFYVTDVESSGPIMNHELHVALDDSDFLALFPMKGGGRARLIGTVRQEVADRHKMLSWDDVSKRILDRMRIDVKRVNWFSTYHVHHRVANHFRVGHVFLLGDAAHIHSPVGAQGMNTGIGDAVNLAWKLGMVLRGRVHARILDSYEPERIGFAQRLVATTDRIFTLVTSDGRMARFIRLHIAPRLIPVMFASKAFRHFMFRTISQTAVNYRDSSLSTGCAGNVHGGDRLPWVTLDGSAEGYKDNFGPLTTFDWQVHVYGESAPELVQACAQCELTLHTFRWQPNMRRAGLMRNAIYLLRPDGYVGLADPQANVTELESYLNQWDLR